MTIEWSGLQPEEIETKRTELRAKIEALLAKQDAHAAAVKAGSETLPAALSPQEAAELTALTGDLAASNDYANFDPSDALAAARNALNPEPAAEAPAAEAPAAPAAETPLADVVAETGGVEQAATDAVAELEKQLAETNEMLAAARAQTVAGVTATDPNTAQKSEEAAEAVVASASADLQYVNRDGEISVVTDNVGLSTAFTKALSGQAAATFLKSERFAADTPQVTGENEAEDWKIIQDVVMNAKAAFGCPDGSCADECDNVINDPSDIFCVGGTPFLDRMPSIPAGENCSVAYYKANKPVSDDEYHRFILCQQVDDGAGGTRNASGWITPDGTFVEQTETDGVLLDKPAEVLDVDCYTKDTKTLQGTFANYWIRQKDDMCNRRKVGMALERKLASMEKALERDAIAQSYQDTIDTGHAYMYDAAATGLDAIGEWMSALAAVLPGEIDEWCIDPTRYTPMWSQGLDKFLNVGRIRSGGELPTFAEMLAACGLNINGGFASSCDLPGATSTTWEGTPGSVATLAPKSVETHSLWLVDFTQLPKLVGPSRRISDDQSASAAIKDARFVQFEDFMCPIPVGPTPIIALNVKACNNGTTVGEADFTCVE